MTQSTLKFASKLAVVVLFVLGLIELAFALWTVLDPRYKSLAYNLADVGYIDLWILRYLSLCLFASSIITVVMCIVLVWGLFSTHALIFIASTMLVVIAVSELTVSILAFANKYQTRLTLIEQLPKLVITYRQGNDERAMRALDILQFTFRCCGAEGRLSFQNNVPLSCNMFSVGCLNRTLYFLDLWMDALAYILLFFSLIKLFIVLFFYSFVCVNYRNRRNRSNPDTSPRQQSVSFDSSSGENLPRQHLLSPTIAGPDEHTYRYTEKRRVLANDYDSSAANQRVPIATTTIVPTLLNNNDVNEYYAKQHTSRKLSSISERTEKTETDESEPDLLRLKFYIPNRKTIPTTVQPRHHPPQKLPVIKARRKLVRDDDYDNDSGVERSSSEKSFEDQCNQKQSFDTTEAPSKSKLTNTNSSTSLSFSNVFITSVSELPSTEDELKNKPLTTAHPHRSPSNEIITPKPILKKPTGQTSPLRNPSDYYNQKRLSSIYTKASPLLKKIPKPNPRSSLKQNDSLL